jgi:hypothetical protein
VVEVTATTGESYWINIDSILSIGHVPPDGPGKNRCRLNFKEIGIVPDHYIVAESASTLALRINKIRYGRG